MEFINNINLLSLGDTALSLTAAFIFGGLIGLERQYRQRTAGLRTNILVALGAAIFVDAGNRLTGHDGAVHVMAYVVSGIGFLGAGVILLVLFKVRWRWLEVRRIAVDAPGSDFARTVVVRVPRRPAAEKEVRAVGAPRRELARRRAVRALPRDPAREAEVGAASAPRQGRRLRTRQ